MAATIQAYEGCGPPKVAAPSRTGCGTVASQPSCGRPERTMARSAPGRSVVKSAERGPNEAVRAEPATIGTGRARDPLGLEIRLLGSLLGQVIAEQSGRELLDLVERVRKTTIRLRRGDDPSLRAGLVGELQTLDPDRAEIVIRAFSLYFRLVNLAEERELVREARRHERRRVVGGG